MTAVVRALAVVHVALVTFACGGGDRAVEAPDPGGPDTPTEDLDAWPLDAPVDAPALVDAPVDLDANAPDAAPELVPACVAPSSGFLCPCTADADCLAGLCVPTPAGGRCSTACDPAEGCADPAWSCVIALDTCPSPCATYCAWNHLDLCRPCRSDADCANPRFDLNVICLPYGDEGSFCASPCGTDRSCPDGATCLDVVVAGASRGSVCKRSAGLCGCTPEAVALGLQAACRVRNAYGACPGLRTCRAEGLGPCVGEPAKQEKCNLKDDNCDGLADLPFEGTVCKRQNRFGTCYGGETCTNGTLSCEAPEPAREVCDGLDNDCDGRTDEDFDDVCEPEP